MFDINGWELVIIVVVALLVIGPERLPEYVARLRQGIRDLKKLADGAKTQLRDQMGPEFDDVDWSAYDPRQYDPRRIVRDALAETWENASPQDTRSADTKAEPADSVGTGSGGSGSSGSAGREGSSPARSGSVRAPGYAQLHDPAQPVPFDDDAT